MSRTSGDIESGANVGCTAEDILLRLQERVDSWETQEMTIRRLLDERPNDARKNIQIVDDRCDRMIEIIEEYRKSFSMEIDELSQKYKQKLQVKLMICTQRGQLAQDLLDKCAEGVFGNARKLDNQYELVTLNALLQKCDLYDPSYIERKELQSQTRVSMNLLEQIVDGMPWKSGYEGPENGPGFYEDISIGSHVDLKSERKLYVDIPMKQKCQMVIEHWSRTECGIWNPPLLVISEINKFSALGSLEESFVELRIDSAHSPDSPTYPCFQISPKGDQCSLIADHHSKRYGSSIFGNVVATGSYEYRWKLKVVNVGESESLFIGVVRATFRDKYPLFPWWKSGESYAYESRNGCLCCDEYISEWKKYGKRYGAEDIIEIVLDLRDDTIMFGKNGIFYRKHPIEERTSYRLAVGVRGGDQVSIKLLSCFRNVVSENSTDDKERL